MFTLMNRTLSALCLTAFLSVPCLAQQLNCVSSWGADPSGTNDTTTNIQNCLNALVSGQLAYLPKGTYKISNTLYLGNGSGSSASSVNNVGLVGEGPYGVTTGGSGTGSNLKWIGTTSVPMLEVRGPIQGVSMDRVGFDCGKDGTPSQSAGIGLQVTHSLYSRYSRLIFINCQTWGFTVMARGSNNFHADLIQNTFDQLNVTNSAHTAAGGFQVGLSNTGLGGPSGTHRNQFNNVEIACWASGNTGIGAEIRAAKYNHYRDLFVIGCSKSVHFSRPSGDSSLPSHETFDKGMFGVTPTWSTDWAPTLATRVNFIDFHREWTGADPTLQSSYGPAFPSKSNIWGNDIQGWQYNVQ